MRILKGWRKDEVKDNFTARHYIYLGRRWASSFLTHERWRSVCTSIHCKSEKNSISSNSIPFICFSNVPNTMLFEKASLYIILDFSCHDVSTSPCTRYQQIPILRPLYRRHAYFPTLLLVSHKKNNNINKCPLAKNALDNVRSR